jgi:hypothetical protein
VALDDRFQISSEAAVQRNRRAMLLSQAKRFGEPPHRALDSNAQHHRTLCIIVDDNLCSGADAGKQTGEIAGCFGLRNVDHCHMHDDTQFDFFFSS